MAAMAHCHVTVVVGQRWWFAAAVELLLLVARLTIRLGGARRGEQLATAACRFLARHGLRYEVAA